MCNIVILYVAFEFFYADNVHPNVSIFYEVLVCQWHVNTDCLLATLLYYAAAVVRIHYEHHKVWPFGSQLDERLPYVAGPFGVSYSRNLLHRFRLWKHVVTHYDAAVIQAFEHIEYVPLGLVRVVQAVREAYVEFHIILREEIVRCLENRCAAIPIRVHTYFHCTPYDIDALATSYTDFKVTLVRVTVYQ